ncbi:MAG: hypothetical protein JSW20_06970 [Nitrospiraceae bacterium]|nr:MAG: hypothetical protein JSW20_06970 [Nitrospiraceae bacterium]
MASQTEGRFKSKCMRTAIVLVIVLSLASSCGESLVTLLSGGGISGTGRFLGIIAGFGSIFVNGVEIETTSETNIFIDDVSANENALRVGMKVEVIATDNVASTVTYNSEIRGPIESGSLNIINNTFSVLGQTVMADGTTVYDGLSGFAQLQENYIVEVSGFADATGTILATFVELEDSGLQEFKLRGNVSNHNATVKRFFINNITVDYNTLQNPPSIANGSSVEVKGTLDNNIFIASEIEIEDFSLASGEKVELEGIITAKTSQTDFSVGPQQVQINADTVFEHGTAAGIETGMRIEVKGSVNSNSILVAERVEFRFVESKSIEIEGIVETIDTDKSTVTVMGITIHVDTNTGLIDEVFELRPFTLSNIQPGDFLEIRGFVDNEGNIVAIILERDEMPEQDEFEFRGPVDAITPNTAIEILGVWVDPGAALDNSNDAAAFFNEINVGDIVKVKGGFSGRIFTANELEIVSLN